MIFESFRTSKLIMLSKNALDKIGDLLMEKSVTDSTMRNKDYMWEVFSRFCSMYNETPVPCSSETLVRYAVYLVMQQNCSVPTVKNHLSVIRRYHKMFVNIEVPTLGQYLPLAAVLKGAANI